MAFARMVSLVVPKFMKINILVVAHTTLNFNFTRENSYSQFCANIVMVSENTFFGSRMFETLKVYLNKHHFEPVNS